MTPPISRPAKPTRPSPRAKRLARARAKLGDARLLGFLKWAREVGGALACELINKRLDSGETLDAILGRTGESGYTLEAREKKDGTWRIRFGYVSPPMLGDGIECGVEFDATGQVVKSHGSFSMWRS